MPVFKLTLYDPFRYTLVIVNIILISTKTVKNVSGKKLTVTVWFFPKRSIAFLEQQYFH